LDGVGRQRAERHAEPHDENRSPRFDDTAQDAVMSWRASCRIRLRKGQQRLGADRQANLSSDLMAGLETRRAVPT